MTVKDEIKVWVRFLALIGWCFIVTPAVARGQTKGDRFSVGTLSQSQFVSATRAPDGSSVHRRYLKASCRQELEAANRLPGQHFATCADLADYMAGAGVRSCPAEVSLDYLVGSKVAYGEHRSREPGEQCLWRDGVWIASLNCGNFFSVQPPPSPLTNFVGQTGPQGLQGPMGPQGPQGPPGSPGRYVSQPSHSCWSWSSWCRWAVIGAAAAGAVCAFECRWHVKAQATANALTSRSRHGIQFGGSFIFGKGFSFSP